MVSRGLYCLSSEAKVGKSMFCLQLSNAITNGTQFLGHNTMPSPVLYISTESDFGQTKERIELLNLKFPKDSFFVIDRNGKGNIDLSECELDIKDFAENKKGKLIIIDMLKDIDLGINYDINNYQDIGQKVLPKLRSICDKYGVAILFTHHLNKQGKILGSTAFDGVVDGKLTLIEDKNDKSLIKLNIINRYFSGQDIYLKKSSNQIFNVTNPSNDEDINYNLILFIKYVVDKKDFDFTCSEIINKANILLTPKQFGRLLNSNIDFLKQEGIFITNNRNATMRSYHAHYEEPTDENS